MKTPEEIKRMDLQEFVFFMNSMTTTELLKQFPGEFHKLKASDTHDESIMNMLANDAILWRMVKEHAQYLASLVEIVKAEEVKTYDAAQDKWRTPAELFFMAKLGIEEIPKNRIILDAFEIIEMIQEYADLQKQPPVTKTNKEQPIDTSHLCVVCHKNWVDSDNGFDTCPDCMNRI